MTTQPLDSDTKTCPYCAETIKAAAIICRYCGHALPGHEGQIPPSPGAEISSGPQAAVATYPIGIEDIQFEAIGPAVLKKKGLFRETYYGRGFRLSFAVLDNAGAWVPADGDLALALVPDRSGFSRAFRPAFEPDEQGIVSAEGQAIFFKRLILDRKDAAWTSTLPDTGRSRAGIRYAFAHPEPPLFSHEMYEMALHLWFRSLQGRMLYGNASTWWRP